MKRKDEHYSEEHKETLDFLSIFYNARKYILLSTLAASLLAVAITFFIKPEYLSAGTVMPTVNNSLEGTVDNPSFGYDIEADRLIQILNSNEIQDTVMKRYNLINYFEMDTTDLEWNDDLRKKYSKMVYFARTPYMSVVISAQTKDPILSANMVNTIIGMIDPIRNRLLKSNMQVAYTVLRKQYLDKKSIVDSLVGEISKLRKESGNPPVSISHNQEFTFSNIEKLKTNNTELEEKINLYFSEEALMNDLKMRYEKASNNLFRPLPSVYVINRATPSYKRAYPSFLVNMLIAAFGTFIFSLMIVYIKDRVQHYNFS
ncbi:MAG: hypothetical protein ACHQK8_07055 [Bacteroidia bacterium]